MATVLLVRHGRTTANVDGTLAGTSPGVLLDDRGVDQARRLAERLAPLHAARIVTSPLERCRQTAELLVGDRSDPPVDVEVGLTECDYGEWTGRKLTELAKLKLWRVVQDHPSGVEFPGGERLQDVQSRAVAAVRRWDARITTEHGNTALWVAVSHADVIKAIVADALGMHLDLFQRIVVDPASVTAIRYTERRPFVLRQNDTGGELTGLVPVKRRGRKPAEGDAVVGGGAGAVGT